jgi:hypothetical protein
LVCDASFTHTYTDTDRQTERERQRETERDRDRDRQAHVRSLEKGISVLEFVVLLFESEGLGV